MYYGGGPVPSSAHERVKSGPVSYSTPTFNRNTNGTWDNTSFVAPAGLSDWLKKNGEYNRQLFNDLSKSRHLKEFKDLTDPEAIDVLLALAHKQAERGFYGGSFPAAFCRGSIYSGDRDINSRLQRLSKESSGFRDLLDKFFMSGLRQYSETQFSKFNQSFDPEDPADGMVALQQMLTIPGSNRDKAFHPYEKLGDPGLKMMLPSARRFYFWNWARLQSNPVDAFHKLVEWPGDFPEAIEAAETPEVLRPYVDKILRSRGTVLPIANEIIFLDDKTGGRIKAPEFEQVISKKFRSWDTDVDAGKLIDQYREVCDDSATRAVLTDEVRRMYVDRQLKEIYDQTTSNIRRRSILIVELKNSETAVGRLDENQKQQIGNALGKIAAEFMPERMKDVHRHWAHDELFRDHFDQGLRPGVDLTLPRDVGERVELAIIAGTAHQRERALQANVTSPTLNYEIPSRRNPFALDEASPLPEPFKLCCENVLERLILGEIRSPQINLSSLNDWLSMSDGSQRTEFETSAYRIISKAEVAGVPQYQTLWVLNEILRSCGHTFIIPARGIEYQTGM